MGICIVVKNPGPVCRNRVPCAGTPSIEMGTLGRAKEAAEVARELDDLARSTYVPPYFLALSAAGRNQRDEAVRWLERGHADRDPYMVELMTSPWLDSVRGDARVQRLIRTMGFATESDI